MPQTEIYRDLNFYQLLLGKPLHALLRKRADLAMRAGTLALCQPIPEQEWDERVEGAGVELIERLRIEIDAQFGLIQIRRDATVISGTVPAAAPTVTSFG